MDVSKMGRYDPEQVSMSEQIAQRYARANDGDLSAAPPPSWGLDVAMER